MVEDEGIVSAMVRLPSRREGEKIAGIKTHGGYFVPWKSSSIKWTRKSLCFCMTTRTTYHRASLSSTHRLTAFLPCIKIQLLLHLFSFLSLSPFSFSCSLLTWFNDHDLSCPPSNGVIPQSSHNDLAHWHIPQISFQSTSKRIYHFSGKGILRKREVRRIEAQAITWGGCMAYTGVRSLYSINNCRSHTANYKTG